MFLNSNLELYHFDSSASQHKKHRYLFLIFHNSRFETLYKITSVFILLDRLDQILIATLGYVQEVRIGQNTTR